MEYEFSLDRKRIILLVSGLVLASVFLFAAGLMVGLAHSGTSAATQTASNPNQMGSLAAIANQPSAPNAAAQTPAPATETTTAEAPSAQPPAPAAPSATVAKATPARSRTVAAERARSHHAVPAAAAVEHGGYYLQAGAFSSADHAIDLQSRLMKLGYPAEVDQARVKGRAWFIVKAGHYASRSAAASAAEHVRTKLGIQPAIRH